MDWKYINNFIGLPFKLGGQDKNGIDCINLIRNYLVGQGYQVELDKRCTAEWIKKANFKYWKRLIKSYGEPISLDKLQENDILYFAWKDEVHAGVYIGYNKYLHVSEKTPSRISKLNDAARKYVIAVMRPSKTEKKILLPAGRSAMQGIMTVAGAVVGAVIGSFFGATLQGAIIGASIGYQLFNPGPGDLEPGGDLAKSPKYRFGGLRTTRSNEIPVALIYGNNRISGNILYSRLADEDKTCYQLIGLGEGEIESISNVKINREPIEDFSGCSYTGYTGTAVQDVDSRATSEVICYGLRHLAYIAATWYASEELPNIPSKVTCEVEGLKIETWDSNAWTTTKTYSKNPSACIRDYLIRDKQVGGVGLIKATMINNTEFGEVYDYCNGAVSDGEGGIENRYELDYVIDTMRNAIDNLIDMLASFGGYIIISGSTVTLKVKKSVTSIHSFTMSNIKTGSFSYSYIPKDNQINRIGVQYIDIEQEDTRPIAWLDDFTDQDERGVHEKVYPTYGIGRMSQAVRMAWQILYDLKINPIVISFETDITALHMEAGDIFKLSHDVPNWTEKLFLTTSIQEKENNEYLIRAVAYNSSIYNDTYGSGIMTYDYGSPPNLYANPPDVEDFIVTSDGTNLTFKWTRPTQKVGAKIIAYEIHEGQGWNAATVVTRISYEQNEYIRAIGTVGTRIFYIKALSEYGRYSSNAGTDSIVITKIYGSNIILSKYIWEEIYNGTPSAEMQRVWTPNYNSEYYRKSLTPRTATTWEDHEIAGRSWTDLEAYDWDIPVVTSSENFEFPEIDLGATHTDVPTSITQDVTGTSTDIVVQWRYGLTTPLIGAWETFVPESYSYRYIQFRIVMQHASALSPTYLNDILFRIDAYDITERGTATVTSPGGATITFEESFGDTPAIIVSTVGSSVYKPIITARSKTAFTVKLYDKNDVEQSGDIDWHARGWFTAI